jgi:cardiolipin synthase
LNATQTAIPERIARRFAWAARPRLYEGNRVRLLATAQNYFPQLLAAIDGARTSVHLETYIFADDGIGRRVVEALASAAARGVQVRVLIDGFGGGDHARRLVGQLAGRAVQVRIFRPERWWRLQRRLFRRLHRKIVVVDDRIAFVGGINIEDDPAQDGDSGDPIGPRFDFAVMCEGPLVAAISYAVQRLWWAISMATLRDEPRPPPRLIRGLPPLAQGVRASLLLRDNLRSRHAIERAYLAAFATARREILIASAYFLPGRRFRAALVQAARRGVRVRLLLQGRIEYRLQHHAQRALYGHLLAAGLEIYEYRRSYLHAKVAVVDSDWATVGSSNIDPLSLLLAREANVLVRDRGFAAELRSHIAAAIRSEATRLQPSGADRSLRARVMDWIAYGVVRILIVVAARGRDY